MDRLTMQELKKAAAAVASAYDLTAHDAARVIGFYNSGDNISPQTIRGFLSGDLSAVPAACSALGIPLKKPVLDSKKNNHTNDNKPATASNKAIKATKKQKVINTPIKEKDTAPGLLAASGDLQADNDIINNNDFDGLPAGVPDLIYGFIDSFCQRENIEDLKKERQTMWKALCMELGACIFKKSKLLHDIQKEKTVGGIQYDYKKLIALCSLWGSLCFKFGKVPTIDDFAHFAGVSDTFIYCEYKPNEASPARALLLKKLHMMQESGLAGAIVDGRQNPTGALAALNHWHGWTQTREIIHTGPAAAVGSSELPKLTDNIV